MVRLTSFSHGAGCACKLGPDELREVLRNLPPVTDARVLVDARGQATGVRAAGQEMRADCVVANCDVAHLYGRLLDGTKARASG